MSRNPAKDCADATIFVVATVKGVDAPVVSLLIIPSTKLYGLMITTYMHLVQNLPVYCMSNMRMLASIGNCPVMFYTWIKLKRKLLIISTISCCQEDLSIVLLLVLI